MTIFDIFLSIISTFLVGMSYVIVKYGLDYFGPLGITAVRYLIVTVILCPFFIKELRANNFPWLKMLAMGLNMAIGFQTLIVTAINTGLDVATSIICQQLSVPFSVILGAYLYKDKLNKKNMLGLIIAFSGMLIVVGSPTLNDNLTGVLLATASAFFYAINNMLVKSVQKYSPLLVLAATSLLTCPIMFLLSYLIEDITVTQIINAPFWPWFATLYLAIPTSIISFGLWIFLLQKYPVHYVVPFSLLAPIFATIGSLILLDELPTYSIIVGGALTLIGILIINLKRAKI